MLRRWESQIGTFGFIKRVDKGRITTVNDLDLELTLEMSAFQIVHGGNSTFIKTFDKTQITMLQCAIAGGRTKGSNERSIVFVHQHGDDEVYR